MARRPAAVLELEWVHSQKPKESSRPRCALHCLKGLSFTKIPITTNMSIGVSDTFSVALYGFRCSAALCAVVQDSGGQKAVPWSESLTSRGTLSGASSSLEPSIMEAAGVVSVSVGAVSPRESTSAVWVEARGAPKARWARSQTRYRALV